MIDGRLSHPKRPHFRVEGIVFLFLLLFVRVLLRKCKRHTFLLKAVGDDPLTTPWLLGWLGKKQKKHHKGGGSCLKCSSHLCLCQLPKTPHFFHVSRHVGRSMEVHGDDGARLPSLGDRVVDGNGFRATVRYVGPVCTAKDPTSLWIGETQRLRGERQQD